MKRALAVLIFLCGAPVLLAQTTDDEVRRESFRALSATNISATNLNTTSGSTATDRDFVSMIIMAVEAAQDGKPVTFDWNFNRSKKSTFQLEAVLTQPDLASNLAAKISNAAQADRLKKSLDYADDVTATLSWTNSDKFEKQFAAVQAAADRLPSDSAELREAARVMGVTAPEARQRALRRFARDVAQASQARSHVFVSGSFRRRSNLAGGNEWKAIATYSMPMGAAPAPAAQLRMTPAANDSEDQGPAEPNTRVALSAELKRTNANHIFIAADGDFPAIDNVEATPSSHSYIAKASWGSNVYRPKDRNRTGRLELALNYDDVTGDPNKNNRLVGTLSYTQQINEKTSLPIALVYANKTEFVGDVNKRLGVHFGLSFKLADMNR